MKNKHPAKNTEATPDPISLGRFVVSVIMIKETWGEIHTQNKLYYLRATSREEAHGKALSLAQSDFPGYRLHTVCSYDLNADTNDGIPT
jgi:hypothetical protein